MTNTNTYSNKTKRETLLSPPEWWHLSTMLPNIWFCLKRKFYFCRNLIFSRYALLIFEQEMTVICLFFLLIKKGGSSHSFLWKRKLKVFVFFKARNRLIFSLCMRSCAVHNVLLVQCMHSVRIAYLAVRSVDVKNGFWWNVSRDYDDKDDFQLPKQRFSLFFYTRCVKKNVDSKKTKFCQE